MLVYNAIIPVWLVEESLLLTGSLTDHISLYTSGKNVRPCVIRWYFIAYNNDSLYCQTNYRLPGTSSDIPGNLLGQLFTYVGEAILKN